MEIMVTPMPIFSKNRDVMGYYLTYQCGNALLEEGKPNSQELSLDMPFFSLLNKVGLEALSYNTLAFVPVTNILLATDLEKNCQVDRTSIVLMLNKNITLSEANLQRIRRFRDLDFKIAFYSYHALAHLEAFLPLTDYLFVPNTAGSLIPVMRYLKMKSAGTQIIATGINSAKDFDMAVFHGAEWLEGPFYKLPASSNDRQVSPLQLNYIQLLNQVKGDDFDFGTFAKVVQRDTALTLQFLRMVNSSIISGNKIRNLKHAAAMLGQNEIKRWITTAVSAMLSRDKPSELTRISLLRARFCENMGGYFELAVHKDNLFLMGLLSVLDVILDVSMEEAFNMVMVPDMVRDALVLSQGELAPVLEFVTLYEHGNWYDVSRIALLKGIKISDIQNAYADSLMWYGRTASAKDPEDLEEVFEE